MKNILFSAAIPVLLLGYSAALQAGPSPGPAPSGLPLSTLGIPSEPGHEIVAQPAAPAPSMLPPAPPSTPPPPQIDQAQVPAQPPATGQWVYTSQYGWVWMPYAEKYVYTSPGANPYPYQYVFVSGAWTWVAAPWVWGWGSRPWYGYYGPGRFGWYRGSNFYYHGGARVGVPIDRRRRIGR